MEANLDALRRLGIYPTEEEKPLVMVPGAEAQSRVDALIAAAGLQPRGFIHVHPTSRWLFKTWTEAQSAELLRRLARDGHRIVVTSAPDPREKAIVARTLGEAGVPVTDLSGELSLRELAALTGARAALLRRGLRAHAHRGRHGHAGRGPLRPERREGMGTVARAAPRGGERPSLPPVRQRRLRRRQGERVPHAAAGGSRAFGDQRSARGAVSAAPSARAPGIAPRVALVRGRYDPSGGAERFVQGAIAALRAQGAAITIVARAWPDHDGSAILVEPFHIGSLWRDWAFARAACAELERRRFDLVQSHERIACCDVYRAGDGVHAQWLAERSRVQGPLARLATRLSPHHLYVLRAERALFSSARLRAVICNSEMVRTEIRERFGTAPEKLVLIRNAVDSAHFHPGLAAEMRRPVREQLRVPLDAHVVLHVGSGFERKGVAGLLGAVARARSRPWAIVVGKDKRAGRYVGARPPPRHRRARALRGNRVRRAPLPRRGRQLHARLALRPAAQRRARGDGERAPGGDHPEVRRLGAARRTAKADSSATRSTGRGSPRRSIAWTRPRAGAWAAAARAAVERYTPQAMAAEYVALYGRLLRR